MQIEVPRGAVNGKWVQLWKKTQWETMWGEEAVGLLASFNIVTSEHRTKLLLYLSWECGQLQKGDVGEGCWGPVLSSMPSSPNLTLEHAGLHTQLRYRLPEVPRSIVVFDQLLSGSDEVNLFFTLMFLSFNLFICAMRLRIHSLPILNNYHEHNICKKAL